MNKHIFGFIRSHWLLVTVIFAIVVLLISIPAYNLWTYNVAEASYHVKNRGTISIENIQDKANLEVLKVSDVEYITNEKKEDKVISWLEVPGNGVFTIDMSLSEFIVDDVHNYVLARVPKPEIQTESIEIDTQNIKKLFYKDNRWIDNGSIEEGENLAIRQLSEAQTKIQEDIQSNERYFEIAKTSAESIIKQLIRSVNEDVTNLDIEVEFY